MEEGRFRLLGNVTSDLFFLEGRYGNLFFSILPDSRITQEAVQIDPSNAESFHQVDTLPVIIIIHTLDNEFVYF